MNKACRWKISDALARQQPHPTTELTSPSPFELLIAVLLSRAGNRRQRGTIPPNLPGRQYASRDAGTGRVEGVKSYIKTTVYLTAKAEKRVIKDLRRILPDKHTVAKCRRTGGAGSASRRGA